MERSGNAVIWGVCLDHDREIRTGAREVTGTPSLVRVVVEHSKPAADDGAAAFQIVGKTETRGEVGGIDVPCLLGESEHARRSGHRINRNGVKLLQAVLAVIPVVRRLQVAIGAHAFLHRRVDFIA